MDPNDPKTTGEETLIDQSTLQRLVDSALTNQEIANLLKVAERQNQWKQLAIAFTENQIWNRAFADLAVTNDPTVEDSAVNISAGATPKTISIDRPKVYPDRCPKVRATAVRPLSAVLAASALIGLIAVYQFTIADRLPKSVRPPAERIAVNPLMDAVEQGDGLASAGQSIESNQSIKSFDRITLASYTPDHRLSAEDLTAIKAGRHTGDVPLFNARRFDNEHLSVLKGKDLDARRAMFAKILPNGISSELRQQVESSGGMVDENLEFISGRLDDGRSYLIPYRTIRFLPGQ